MIHPLHNLLDNRPLIEIVGDKVRSSANQFNPARMRLMIRPSPLKPGQKRVMNINRPPGKQPAGLIRKNLHIPRKNHKLRTARLKKFQHLSLLQ